jgi:hypothetical protein
VEYDGCGPAPPGESFLTDECERRAGVGTPFAMRVDSPMQKPFDRTKTR